jgi:hypothetical protein
LKQRDHLGAQVPNFIIARSEFKGAARLKISFCPRPPSFIWFSCFPEGVIG